MKELLQSFLEAFLHLNFSRFFYSRGLINERFIFEIFTVFDQ